MKSELLIFVISIQFLFYTISVSGNWPYNINKQFDFSTPSPLDLNTSKAIALTNFPPLSIVITTDEALNVANNGRTIVATPMQPSKAKISGSIFKDLNFVFVKIFLVISNDPRDRSGTVMDGEWTPIEFAHVFMNDKYSSIEEARTHRDGLIMLIKQVLLNGVIPNKNYPPFANIARKVQEPNSSTVAPAISFYKFYDRLEEYTNYFVHPGSYIDPDTGLGYQAANILIFGRDVRPSITLSEFSVMQQFITNDGLPMSNSLPSFEMGPIPLAQGQDMEVRRIQANPMSMSFSMSD